MSKQESKETWAQRNPDSHRRSARGWWRRWNAANPGEHKKRQRNWRLANPEKSLLQEARKRARKKSLEFSIDLADVQIPEACPILGIPIIRNTGGRNASPNSPTLDRIDPSKGYIRNNVWVISWRANKLKSDATLKELELLVSALQQKLTERTCPSETRGLLASSGSA